MATYFANANATGFIEKGTVVACVTWSRQLCRRAIQVIDALVAVIVLSITHFRYAKVAILVACLGLEILRRRIPLGIGPKVKQTLFPVLLCKTLKLRVFHRGTALLLKLGRVGSETLGDHINMEARVFDGITWILQNRVFCPFDGFHGLKGPVGQNLDERKKRVFVTSDIAFCVRWIHIIP